MNTVSFRLSERLPIRLSKAAAEMGSRPEVGSSRNKRSGSRARARASAARLIIPPDSSAGFRSPASGGRPARAIFMSARPSIRSSGSLVCSIKGAATFSRTVRLENRAPAWNSTPQFFSIASQSAPLACSRSRPNTLTRPPSGLLSPIRVLSSTDLPDPEPPTTPSTSPRRTTRSRPSCTTWSPKRETRPSTTIGSAVSTSACGTASLIR